ncbi:TlpA family protein disulfide reductase [Nonomuraea insulae]|uniref:TlpA family protein disulfide reductase n=1 Tax=Nonomuraea insulae TaxID=1616787 RepID=A0ABW1D415_9ACTN
MVVLTVAVILVGVLCLLDLLLTFGVIRRLRDHTETLSNLMRYSVEVGVATDIPVVGTAVGEFTASTVDGEPVSTGSLTGTTAVVFLSSGCTTCHAQLPSLVEWARERDRERVLVVVDTSASDGADLVAALTYVARVVRDPGGGPVCAAFGVSAFPAACVAIDGMVVATAPDFSRLPALV